MYSFTILKSRAILRAAAVCLAAGVFCKVASFGESAEPTLVLPIHVIKVSDSDGGRSASINPEQIWQWVDRANQVYASTGIQFRFIPDVNGPDWSTTSNTALNNLSSSDPGGWELADQLAAQYPDKLVVFFRHGPGAGATGNGFAFPPQSGLITNFVAMPGFYDTWVITGKDVRGQWIWSQNIGLLAHEIGHYLGLYHTFPGWSDDATDTFDKASDYIAAHGGRTDAFDGDHLADTPPEAGTALYINSGWDPCLGHNSYTIEGSIIDGTPKNPFHETPFRLTFTPDRHNVMSYFPCEPHTFTASQIDLMRRTLQSRTSPGDLTGTWLSEDGGLYYLRQLGSTVWWAGLSTESPRGLNDFHLGLRWSNVFRGQLNGNIIDGEWADIPRGGILQSGHLTLTATSSAELRRTAATGGFGAIRWTRIAVSAEACDMPCRFRYVRRNDGDTMANHLEGGIADYNHVATGVVLNGLVANFPPAVPRTYFNFMCPTANRHNPAPWFFNPFDDPPDGDVHFDMRVQAEGRNYHPELVMFGRSAGDRFCGTPGQFNIPPLLPGWAETAANSVLLNGRPIDGRVAIGTSAACSSISVDNERGVCPVSAILNRMIGSGTAVRITGAKAIDEHGTLELHPVYAIDIIQNFHLPRPGADLTGVWSSTDEGTYFIRQIGNTVWWFGMSRDRGQSFANVFHGQISPGTVQGLLIAGEWADIPLGSARSGGVLQMRSETGVDTSVLTRTGQTGGFGGAAWTKLYDVATPAIAGPNPNRN